jgi:hypothetical protein
VKNFLNLLPLVVCLCVFQNAVQASWVLPDLGNVSVLFDGLQAKLTEIGNGRLSGNTGLRNFGSVNAQFSMSKDDDFSGMQVKADDSVDTGTSYEKSLLTFRGGTNSRLGNSFMSISIRTKNRLETMAGFQEMRHNEGEGAGMKLLKHGPIIGQVFRVENSNPIFTADDGRKQVDPFVMQISYDQAEFDTTTNLTELQELFGGCLYLGWLNKAIDGDTSLPSTLDTWVNAIQGNFDRWELFAAAGANRHDPLSLKNAGIVGLNMSYDDYLAGTTTVFGVNTKQAGEFQTGDFGADLANNNMWSVIDHNSDFAAVPEPSTYALILGCLAGVVIFFRRR